MTFSKSSALWIAFLAVLLVLGILIFVYFQGGVGHALRTGLDISGRAVAYISWRT
jgi:preprotein translocase subunit SecF